MSTTTIVKELEIALVELTLAQKRAQKQTEKEQKRRCKQGARSHDWVDCKVDEFRAWHRVQKLQQQTQSNN